MLRVRRLPDAPRSYLPTFSPTVIEQPLTRQPLAQLRQAAHRDSGQVAHTSPHHPTDPWPGDLVAELEAEPVDGHLDPPVVGGISVGGDGGYVGHRLSMRDRLDAAPGSKDPWAMAAATRAVLPNIDS